MVGILYMMKLVFHGPPNQVCLGIMSAVRRFLSGRFPPHWVPGAGPIRGGGGEWGELRELLALPRHVS